MESVNALPQCSAKAGGWGERSGLDTTPCLTFATSPAPSKNNIYGKDLIFADVANRNFRLQKGSLAIAAGEGGPGRRLET